MRANLQVSAVVDIACLRPCGDGGYCVNLAGTAGCRLQRGRMGIHLLWIVCVDRWNIHGRHFKIRPKIKIIRTSFLQAARANDTFKLPQHHHVPSRQSPPHAVPCHAPPACPCFLPPTCWVLHATLPVILPAYLSGPRLPPSPGGHHHQNPIVQPVPSTTSTTKQPSSRTQYRTPSKSPDSSPTLHHSPWCHPKKRSAVVPRPIPPVARGAVI